MFGRLFGFEWYLLDYKAQFGGMPRKVGYRFIEQSAHRKRERIVSFGRWQLILRRVHAGRESSAGA